LRLRYPYYHSLVATFKDRVPSALFAELDKVVAEMEKNGEQLLPGGLRASA
jgi:hypothetical protein